MKRITKRIAALGIMLAMFVGFVPSGMLALGQTLDWAGADATTVYDFTVANGTLKDAFSEYGTNNINWKYNAQSYEGKDTGSGYDSNVGASSSNRLNYYSNKEDGFLALDIKLPSEAGKYTPVLDYYGKLGGKTINFYILDKDTANIKETLKTATPTAWLRRSDREASGNLSKELNNAIEITDAMKGQEAILVLKLDGIFENTPRWTGKYGLIAFKFTLSGEAPAKFASVELKSDKNILLEGKTAQLTYLAKKVSGDIQNLTNASIVFSTSDDKIATVDQTGLVTWKGVGTVDLTVTITLDGISQSDTVSIKCKEAYTGPITWQGEEATVTYDFRYGYETDTSIPHNELWSAMPTDYNPVTNPNWCYPPSTGSTSDSATTTYNQWLRYASDAANGRCWTAKIKLPDIPGKYLVKLVHNGYYCAPIAAMYLYPADATAIYDDFKQGQEKDTYLLSEFELKQDASLKGVEITKNVAIIEVDAESAGKEKILVLRATAENTDKDSLTGGQLAYGMMFRSVIFDGVEPTPLGAIDMTIEKEALIQNETSETTVSVTLADGSAADIGKKSVKIESSDPQTIRVEDDGTLTALKTGNATITATVTLYGVTKSTSKVVYCVGYGGAITNNEIDLMAGLSDNEDVSALTEYDANKNARWKYFGNYVNRTGYAVVKNGSVKLLAVDEDAWSAIKFKSADAGLYTLSIAHGAHSGALGTKVYLVPGNIPLSGIADELSDSRLIGAAEFTAEANGSLQIGAVALKEETEYTLVFKADGLSDDVNEGNATVSVSKLMFVGEEPAPVIPKLSSVSLSVIAHLAVNGANVATVSGTMSDGSAADLTGSTITYSSSNTDAIEINATTGAVLGKALGDSIITVSVTLDNVTKSDSKTVSVIAKNENLEAAGADANVDYKFLGTINGFVNKTKLRTITSYNATTNPNWKIKNATSKSEVFYERMRFITDSESDYLAIVVKMPETAGVYNMSFTYDGYYGAPAVAFYDVPMTATNVLSELTEDNLIGTAVLDKNYANLGKAVTGYVGRYEVQPYEVGQEKLLVLKATEAQTDEAVLNAGGGVGTCGFFFHNINLNGNLDGDSEDTDELTTLKLELDGKTINTALAIGATAKIIASTPGFEDQAQQATYTYVSDNPEVATVDANGVVKGVANGFATIKVTAKLNNTIREIPITIVVGTIKSRASYFTDEKRENAKENIGKYTWASDAQKTVVAAADKYIGREDFLWNIVTTNKLPRGQSWKNDPDYRQCRYCKTDIVTKYSANTIGWSIDAMNTPWKVQCPECRRYFPSNDFGSYYELGIDEYGNWQPELSKQKNDEIIANGGEGYLVNMLHPEMDEYVDKDGVVHNEGVHGWGVDNGFGYDTGKVYASGVKEVHVYIPMYNWYGVWWTSSSVSKGGIIPRALYTLRSAYLYTGEEKYGIAGAILIDRVADVYPDFDMDPKDGIHPNYVQSSGSSNKGKIVGCIGDIDVANDIIMSYDAFWPEMDNPQVISFLADKAEKYKMANPKTSADLIRYNCDNGILRAIRQGVHDNKVWGNFGYQQKTMALAAVTLDNVQTKLDENGNPVLDENGNEIKYGETVDWINWLFTPGKTGSTGAVGYVGEPGNIYGRLTNDVDRDGWGNESAPSYNVGWINKLRDAADILVDYKDTYPAANLYQYPKFLQMIHVTYKVTLASRYVPLIGDTGNFGRTHSVSNPSNYTSAWFAGIKDDNIARMIYTKAGGNISAVNGGIFRKDPESIQREVMEVLNEKGEALELGSLNLTGYGLAMTRDGKWIQANQKIDTQRSYWMFYGNNSGHGHQDKLNLGVVAYGIDMAPDFGNPDTKTVDANRYTHTKTPMAHNAVFVVENQNSANYSTTTQNSSVVSTPIHFDDSDKVKVIDVDASESYNSTEIFRRTIVEVDYNDDVSYAVDFYRVKGGDDHIYNFHAQSDEITVDIPMVEQPKMTTDKKGNPVESSYAGPNVPYGIDELWNATTTSPLKSPAGFTWYKNVYRAANPTASTISTDFKIKDYFNYLDGNPNLHLKLTMLNTDNEITEFAYADTRPPLATGSPELIKQIMARRQGKDLDSLYTTVIQPYKDEAYITSVEEVPVVIKAGIEGRLDTARAVKVTLTNGRTDYVVYATNNNVTYTVDNKFDIQGFVGVVSYDVNAQNGEPIYKYMNDGKQIAGMSGTDAYTGTVVDFTKVMTLENSITVKMNGQYDVNNLKDRYIYIDNDGVQNASYRIENATIDANDSSKVILDIGAVTPIRKYTDVEVSEDFTYNFEAGQTFRIPLPTCEDASPIVNAIPEQTVEAGNALSFKVTAQSQTGNPLTYKLKDGAAGMKFDEATQTFSWTPTSADRGDNFVSFIVSDGLLESVLYVDIKVANSTGGAVAGGDTIPEGGGGGGGSDDPKPEDPKPEDPTDDPSVTPGGDDSGKKFIDLGAHSWAEDAIYRLVEAGVINGTSERTYSPGANITRADFATLIVRLFKFEGEAETFTDVPASKYYAESVGIAKANGIVNGVSETEFAPLKEISREDMMVMLYRALKAANVELEETVELTHSDFDEVSDYAKEAVSVLIKSGLIAGSNGKINPKATATRAEVAVVLNRIYGLIGK